MADVTNLSGPPESVVDGVVLPDALRDMIADATAVPVWRNVLGGLTFCVNSDRFLKWVPHGVGLPSLADEAARLAWVAPFSQVPRVLAHGVAEDGEWLLTAAVPGSSAASRQWVQDPERAARAIGTGLRALHDALPVDRCPFTWSVDERLTAKGIACFPAPPPVDRLVVCHGDACVPNTLVGDDGTWTGHVDLGRLGVADRWADIAVATYSLGWNYGPGYDGILLDGYGIDLDVERTAYYRALWDAE